MIKGFPALCMWMFDVSFILQVLCRMKETHESARHLTVWGNDTETNKWRQSENSASQPRKARATTTSHSPSSPHYLFIFYIWLEEEEDDNSFRCNSVYLIYLSPLDPPTHTTYRGWSNLCVIPFTSQVGKLTNFSKLPHLQSTCKCNDLWHN